MEAISSSETPGATQRATRRHIPEDNTLHTHRCENLKSYLYGIRLLLILASWKNSVDFLTFVFTLKSSPDGRRMQHTRWVSQNCTGLQWSRAQCVGLKFQHCLHRKVVEEQDKDRNSSKCRVLVNAVKFVTRFFCPASEIFSGLLKFSAI
jgi:hypothetical protein